MTEQMFKDTSFHEIAFKGIVPLIISIYGLDYTSIEEKLRLLQNP
jgi:hypothetical protein